MSNDPQQPALHLLHSRPDPRRLAAWAARHGLLHAQGDLGYALHALLHAAFGKQAPQPFRYLDAAQGLLAYTRMTPDELRGHIALADPDVAAALGLGATAEHGGCSLRAFPTRWPVGHVLGFEVRVRPIIREGATRQERDAFLAAVQAAEAAGSEPDDRGTVYRRWLIEQLSVREGGGASAEPWQGAVEVIEVRMERFRLLDVIRQTQPKQAEPPQRQRRAVGGPDAVLAGRLRVVDGQAFAALLARGVGRHRAFGFGMLMLRPGG
ncbi:type I-E CRISPR-associated protein Cas6/Cse3/CasE [Sphaerotilus sp.]|uniref:type I-E CRISPR-associated protein Cas6/Cse3/CasE n=1 Tax=Sphaerotilus sp. TaxID=2093942 RepID=UPI00286EA0E8|nr:type I-E CRISPR-associated protein Cas6/Cse3/CasE [Sphaerotilus sp.]